MALYKSCIIINIIIIIIVVGFPRHMVLKTCKRNFLLVLLLVADIVTQCAWLQSQIRRLPSFAQHPGDWRLLSVDN